jgi:glycosyltransferase involved in cell wall biosynthesis
MEPRVTLAMPVYNGARYIRSAIESVLAQDFGDLELIVTDNASSDATGDICRELARLDKRVRYILNPRNLGAAPNYNRGYELARGQYLKWCAHDDLISPNYVGACLAALEADHGAAVAFGRTICIDGDGHEIDGEDSDEMEAILDTDPARRFLIAILRGGTCFPIFGLFRTSLLQRSTLHRPYYGSDRALIAEMALLGRCLLVPEAVFYNREHPKRSIRLTDHAERSRWQSTSAGRAAAMEHVGLLRHLTEIACRHGDVVAPRAALAQLARFALKPRQLGRVALDLTRYASPSAGARLRRIVVGRPSEGSRTAGP